MRLDAHRRSIALVPALVALTLAGCGKDMAPADDHTVYFPADTPTIQGAIDLAQPGDQVIIAAGEYTVDAPLVLRSSKNGVILRGADGSRPSLVFTVSPDSMDAIVILATDVSVRNLAISGTFRVGILVQPSGSEGGGDVSDCTVKGANWYGVDCGSAAANITIQRNILVDSGQFGVVCSGNNTTPVVENNTIVGSGDCAIYVDTYSSPEIRRNVLVDSVTYGVACFTAQPVVLDCNVLYQNGVSDYSPECVPGSADQHADPMFCDPETFTLLPGSPCAPANAGSCQGIGAVTTVCTVTP